MRLSKSVAFFALAQVIACSSSTTSPTAGSSSSSPSAAAESSATSGAARGDGDGDADEATRAQAFVDARYPRSAVEHSFRTKLGDTIDCIDFFAQPGVRALAAQGTPIPALPRPVERARVAPDSPLAGVMFDGSFANQ